MIRRCLTPAFGDRGHSGADALVGPFRPLYTSRESLSTTACRLRYNPGDASGTRDNPKSALSAGNGLAGRPCGPGHGVAPCATDRPHIAVVALAAPGYAADLASPRRSPSGRCRRRIREGRLAPHPDLRGRPTRPGRWNVPRRHGPLAPHHAADRHTQPLVQRPAVPAAYLPRLKKTLNGQTAYGRRIEIRDRH